MESIILKRHLGKPQELHMNLKHLQSKCLTQKLAIIIFNKTKIYTLLLQKVKREGSLPFLIMSSCNKSKRMLPGEI